jgi:hypothetical protein
MERDHWDRGALVELVIGRGMRMARPVPALGAGLTVHSAGKHRVYGIPAAADPG